MEETVSLVEKHFGWRPLNGFSIEKVEKGTPLAGGLLASWITGRITKQNSGRIADTAVVAACLLIAGGRIICGLIFKDQGIGFPLEDWFNTEWLDPEEAEFANRFSLFALEDYSFFERLPFAVRNYYDEWCFGIFLFDGEKIVR